MIQLQNDSIQNEWFDDYFQVVFNSNSNSNWMIQNEWFNSKWNQLQNDSILFCNTTFSKKPLDVAMVISIYSFCILWLIYYWKIGKLSWCYHINA